MFKRLRTWFSNWRKQRQVAKARRLWVKALRSGEYNQSKHVLCELRDDKPVGYCCLGVGCEVYQAQVGDLEVKDWGHTRTYDGGSLILPEKVARWLNITPKGMLPGSATTALTECNDALGKTFDEIAQIIEANTLLPYEECPC